MVDRQMSKIDFAGECCHTITRAEKVYFAKRLERHVTLTMVKISTTIVNAGVVVILAISFILINPDEQHQPHSEQKSRKNVVVFDRIQHEPKRIQRIEI